MQGIADKLLNRFDKMPRIPFHVKEDSRFYKQGQLHALAFYDPGTRLIYVNPGYTNNAKYTQIVDTVLHELTHAWVHWRGLSTNVAGGHNEAFIRKAIELRLDLTSTLIRYPEARAIHDRLTRGATSGAGDASGDRGRAGIDFGDPSKNEGFFGAGIFQFRFVYFSLAGSPERQEEQLYRVVVKPQIEQQYVWQNANWRIYAITGSIVWLVRVETPSNYVRELRPYSPRRDEWHFFVPADMQQYTLVLPSGRFNVKRVDGKARTMISLPGATVNLDGGMNIDFSLNPGQHIRAWTIETERTVVTIRFKLKD